MPLEKIIVLDDDLMIRKTLEDLLRKKRYSVKSVQTIQDAQKQLLKDTYDLIFIDLKLPDGSGMEILRELHELPNAPMPIMISGHGNMEDVIDCMRLGARDYVIKPFDTEQIELVLKRAENYSQLLKVNQFYSEQQNNNADFIGECEPMENLRRVIRRVAKTECDVLITGENGTGKELVGMELYRNSLLSNQPYIRVNCAAIPENLIESEFFGHEKGSFTGAVSRREGRFELANNGTILLDEIGEISPQVQVKLLRVLQEREFERVGGTSTIRVSVRVLATTNRDLLQAVKDGKDEDARWHMMMAATEGAMAFSKGLGSVHSMSHACGADQSLRLHHGTLNAVILPTILDFNRDHVDDKYSRLNAAMGIENSADPADFIRDLNAEMELPANLTEMGVQKDAIQDLAAHAAKDVSNFTNPRPVSGEEYESLFEIALS